MILLKYIFFSHRNDRVNLNCWYYIYVIAISNFVIVTNSLFCWPLQKVLNYCQKPILIFRYMFSRSNFMQRKRVRYFLIFERRLGYELSDWSEIVLILLTRDVIERSVVFERSDWSTSPPGIEVDSPRWSPIDPGRRKRALVTDVILTKSVILNNHQFIDLI